jgi:DNA-binding beta-propeller fold protein YncE
LRRLAWAIIVLCTVVVWGCGGGDDPDPNAPITSGLTKRAFVSNDFTGIVDIVNASTDTLVAHRIPADSGIQAMALSPNKATTLVFASGPNTLDVINNATEEVAGRLQLGDDAESFFYLPDNNTVYVAVRNTGSVVRWNTSAGSTLSIAVPNPRRIVRSGDGKYVLAFPDDASNTVYFIDTSVATPVAVPVAGFDRPVWAVFSSDNTRAWVMNCGPECGGTTASVQVLNLPGLTLGANAAVPGGATYGLLSSNTLFVAGTRPATACTFNAAVRCGALTKLDVTAAPVVSASYEINDGYHDRMLLAPNNRLFIGAEFTCAAIAPNGCLSIFNTSGNTVVIQPPCGPSCNSLNDVTGMSLISGRNVVYVVEGGEVRIYDTATDAPQSRQVDTVGRSWDVVSPD